MGCNVPFNCSVPVSAGSALCAVSVITTGVEADVKWGCQVADHCPDPTEVSASDGSLVEKFAITSPGPMGEPQSSTILTCNALGQATVALKPGPRAVETKLRSVGVQVEAAAAPLWPRNAVEGAAPVTIMRMLTLWTEPPAN